MGKRRAHRSCRFSGWPNDTAKRSRAAAPRARHLGDRRCGDGVGGDRETIATVRFEVIGKPIAAVRSGIDRGRLTMAFDTSGGDVRITRASLIDGDRISSDAPQFEDVAAAAGVAFKNRYYLPF